MKNIADIYNENAEIAATPANTTGMGNPMAPTDTENGSEPLVAKCKKDKKKCKKCIKEGLLSGQDATLKGGENIACILDYVNILAKSKRMERYDESDINDVVNYCLKYNALVCNKPGEIVCDYSNLEKGARDDRMMFIKSYSLVFAASGIEIDTKLLTKSIKKITFKNFDTEVCLDIFGNNDLSNVDLEFTEGHLKITAMDSDAIVKFGKVNCNTLYVRDNINKDTHPKGISLKTGSTIQILDLSRCHQLGLLIGKKLNIGSITLNPNFVELSVRNSGFANQNTRAWVVNEKYRW
jgi:hypothetical protein